MRKLFNLLSLVVLASMVLAACGGAAPTEAPAQPEEPAATEALRQPKRLRQLKLQLQPNHPPPESLVFCVSIASLSQTLLIRRSRPLIVRSLFSQWSMKV